MKIVLTGASGRVGKAIHARLCAEHEVVGVDRSPSPTADVVASLSDTNRLAALLDGADAVIHCAALHAPHVGRFSDAEFEAVNVAGTEALLRLCLDAGVRRFIFTSTTALYGAASNVPGRAAWVSERTVPLPKTIYHRTKLAAEVALERAAATADLCVTVLRVSRCFPEPAPVMAVQRLHRGVDARDVAEAHAAALVRTAAGFWRYVVSAAAPFLPEDASELMSNAPAVIERRAPALADEFRRRRWPLPASIDRVYDAARAVAELAWTPALRFCRRARRAGPRLAGGVAAGPGRVARRLTRPSIGVSAVHAPC
jgi:UDP-glucose 4-epimerase